MAQVAAETATRIVELRSNGATVKQIAEALEISESHVYQALPKGMKRQWGANREAVHVGRDFSGPETTGLATAQELREHASLKQLTLRTIVEGGPYKTTKELVEDLNKGHHTPVGPHEVVHLLWSLNKAGLITFREDKRSATSSANSYPVNVKATNRGKDEVQGKQQAFEVQGTNNGYGHAREVSSRPADRTDFRTHSAKAEGGEVERRMVGENPFVVEPEAVDALVQATKPPTIDEEPTPEPEWPLLQQLRDKAANATVAVGRAELLLEAAALIADVDAERAADLESEANRLAKLHQLSAFEAEYLAFAEHAGTGVS